MLVHLICSICESLFSRRPDKVGPFCSLKCFGVALSRKPQESVASRIARYSAPDYGGCLLWTGTKHRRGYGLIQINKVSCLVHRVVWELSHGPIPAGMQIHHKCNNPPCHALEHLTIGTPKENSEYMVKSARAATGERNAAHVHPETVRRGEQHHKHKITTEDVRGIRALRAQGMSLNAIAEQFSITPSTVSRIALRKAWGHIE